jgi:hypothetical protein
MAQSYRDFLNKSWGAGATSNANRAAAWRRSQTPAAAVPKPPATPAPPPASFTPGALDEGGARNKGQLDFNYQTGQRGANLDYDQQMAEINAARPQLDKARDKGYQSADRNAASRGIFNSGVRSLNRTEVGADYDEAQRALSRQALNVANRRQLNTDTLTGQYNIDTTNNAVDSNVRQKNTWEEQNPVVTAPVAAAPKAPAVKYKDWLKGRTSTAATAAAWRKSQGI